MISASKWANPKLTKKYAALISHILNFSNLFSICSALNILKLIAKKINSDEK
jgi:hypothetical protein